MATFHLVRHGAHDRLDRYLDGRRPGIHLNALGLRQAEFAAARLQSAAVDEILSSPMERTRETADVIGRRLALPVKLEAALWEIDFGSWSGKTIDELSALQDWQQWNAARAIAPTPAGDSMRACQTRMLDLLDALRRARPDGRFVLVGHSDPLKAVLFFFLGLSLDKLGRIAISPGSLSCIEVDAWGGTVTKLNEAMSERDAALTS